MGTAAKTDGTRGAFVRLAALVTSVVLLTSRVMLLLHEFAGHAAPAALFGGRITGWYLFLFAGGRVSYRLGNLDSGRRLVVSLGGIALELLLGAGAFVLARRLRARAVTSFALVAVGTVLVGHATMYLARGVHYGFGDGTLLAQRLGSARVIVVLVATAVAVAVAVAGGTRLARFAAAFFDGTPRRVAGAVLLVFACAGLVHGALAFAEVRWFPDPAWARVMESASVVDAREELARRVADARQQGEQPPSPEEQARLMRALERARRPWPLDPVLVLAVVGGLVLGVMRGTRAQAASRASLDDEARGPRLPGWNVVGGIVAVLGAVIAVLLVLRHLGAAMP
jgi:hypothetical protein